MVCVVTEVFSSRPGRPREQRAVIAGLIGLTALAVAAAAWAAPEEEDIVQLAIPAVALGVAAVLQDDAGMLQLGQGFSTALAVTYVLKYSIDSDRPQGGPHAFPSGHTTAAFAAATFLERRYGWWLAVPAYVAAGFTGYGRIENRAHSVWDVVAGAGIGLLAPRLFTTRFADRASISARVDRERVTFALDYRW